MQSYPCRKWMHAMRVAQDEFKSALKFRVKRAFSGVSLPAAEQIAYSDDWDSASITRDFGSHVEDSLPASLLERHAGSLSALRPEAFLYFLPQYIEYSIDHIDSEVSDVLISNLVSAVVSETDPLWIQRWQLLQQEQINAIAAYLEYVLDASDAVSIDETMRAAVQRWKTKRSRSR